ncbi:MAG: selenocysteine-specific translation elongation factor [Pyrinomonadaceae bacterium]
MDVIVGTAGHIDHGKTSLVRALTGIDADRLPEEKRRGITIDLGFAEMSVGDTHFGFVDVPGHERFVKNMLAGASGIDIVLLVVAADEGVMPQTREHFEICRLLGVKAGIIALTKSDLVDEEILALARLDVADLVAGSFLADSPVVTISTRTGNGIEELKRTFLDLNTRVTRRDNHHVTRLAIDRSFSIKGFGAVVTGTLSSGEIAYDDEISLLPENRLVRVRGLQTHGRSVKSVRAGQRVAVNLAGIDYSQIERGMTLVENGTLLPTWIVDSEVEVLPAAPKGLRSRQRVRFHLGTSEVLARVRILDKSGEIEAGGTGLAQLSFEQPIVAIPGERFIIRSYSPQMTIAGGRIANTFARKYRGNELPLIRAQTQAFLDATDEEKVGLLIRDAGNRGITSRELNAATGLNTGYLDQCLERFREAGKIIAASGRFLGAAFFEKLLAQTGTAVADFHNAEPLAKGISLEALRKAVFAHLPDQISRAVIDHLQSSGLLVVEQDTVRIAARKMELSAEETGFIESLSAIYQRCGFDVPKLSEAIDEALRAFPVDAERSKKLIQLMLKSGRLAKITTEIYLDGDVLHNLIDRVKGYADTTPDRKIDVAKFKEIAGVSRKYAIPLLEYFDREKITARVGDHRVIL